MQGPVVFSIDRAERRLRELFPGFQGLPEGTRPVFREVVNRYVQFCVHESGALPTPEIVSENTQRLGRALMGPFEYLGVHPERLSRGQFFTYVLAQLNAIALAIPAD